MNDTPEPDARLIAALRHAPDADAAPPAALAQAILRSAREAVAAPAPTAAGSVVQRLRATWSWLARPPVAAGFASVMLATVVGLMWWGRPMDEGLKGAETPVVAEAPAASAAPETEMRSTMTVAARPADAGATASANPSATPPAAKIAEGAAPAAPTPARAATASPAQDAVRPLAAPTAPHPGTPADAARADEPARAVAARPAARAARAEAGAAGVAEAPATALTAAPPPALADLRSATRAEPQRFSWQLERGSLRPTKDALPAWLARADAALASPWRPAGASPPSPAPLPTSTLTVLRDGQPYAVFTLTGDTLRLAQAGSVWRTEFAPGQGEQLRAALIDALR